MLTLELNWPGCLSPHEADLIVNALERGGWRLHGRASYGMARGSPDDRPVCLLRFRAPRHVDEAYKRALRRLHQPPAA